MRLPGSRGFEVDGRRLAAAAAAGGVAALAAWAVQHRFVVRANARRGDTEDEGLEMPSDVVHHWVPVDDGARIHVVERGTGPALVLLHGVLLSSAIWAHQFEELSATHRVVALDFRGHGQSLPGREGFGEVPRRRSNRSRDHRDSPPYTTSPGIRRLTRDTLQVLEALDVTHAVVVGHSMGGMVALDLVDQLPADETSKRLAGLVLVSTTAGPVVAIPGWTRIATVTGPMTSRSVQAAGRVGATRMPSADLRWWAARMGFGAEAPPEQVQFVESLIGATPSSTFAGLVASVAAFDVSKQLVHHHIPVLIVVGTHDRLTPVRHARKLAQALPGAQLVELARCGHMPMLERRHEFSRLIAEFADKAGYAAPRRAG